jgi:hypothetical protein
MSGAVMLLIAATVGISYGWTPDGRDGVKYIIQIPPEQVEQVTRCGEIASQIPAEIRGHVSEVVIRIGNDRLPKITPNHLSQNISTSRSLSSESSDTADRSAALAVADQAPVPIPAFGNPADLRPIGSNPAASTAMMKPAPQGGGMNLPGGLGMTPAANSGSAGPSMNFGQAARDTAGNVANQLRGAVDNTRQQVQQNFNATTERFGEAANTQLQSTANNMRDAASGLFGGSPATIADDPRTRLAEQNAATGSNSATNNVANGPSTDLYGRSAEPPSGYGYSGTSGDAAAPPDLATSRARAGAPSTTPRNDNTRTAATAQPNANATATEDWYDLRNGARRRPSTDPVDSASQETTGSSFAGSNFGRLPAGLMPETNNSTTRAADTTPRTNYATAAFGEQSQRSTGNSNADLQYDPNLTAAQAAQLPKNGYSFDAENYPVDREGYRLDRYGRRVDRQGRLLTAVDAMGNEALANNDRGNIDAYGRTIDTRNTGNYPANTSSSPQLVQPPAVPQSGNFAVNPYPNNSYPTSPYPQSQNPQSQYSSTQYPVSSTYPSAGGQQNLSPVLNPGMPGYPQYNDPRYASLAGQGNQPLAGTNPGSPSMENWATNNTPRSASDSSSRGDRFDETDSALAGGSRESLRAPEQVAAQPIFNALLLLSIVANVYLLFWLKNLRLQFRDMVAAKRAASGNGPLVAGV